MAASLRSDMVCTPHGILSSPHSLKISSGTLTTIKDGKPVREITPTVEPPTWSEYYRKMARALSGEGELPASGAEAAEVIRLIDLVQESSKQGKTLDF
jgi:predicted dehydrogenase